MNETNDPLLLLQKMAEIQDKQQQDKIDECISALTSREIPTPEPIRTAINFLVGEKRQQILRHHMFWREWKFQQGLASLVHAAHQASIDICRHDAALGELARSENFQENVDYAVGYAAQKDAVAYCSLAFGVRDTLEEIRKLRCDIADDIAQIKNSLFDRDISEFIRNLRNNLLHGRVVIPQW